MGEIWIKEAEQLTPAGTSGVMEGGEPRVTWHVTVSPSGRSKGGAQYFDVMDRVLRTNRSEPHVLYDPETDRLGQYFPLNRSARALANDGDRRTNGEGTVNIQIEVVANTSPVFTSYWKPGPNFRALMRAIRSWGIPDEWPAGRLATSYADRVDRSWSSYRKPGHFAHCNVPGNDHWDTGPIDQAALFVASRVANPEEDSMSAADVKELKDYIGALLVNGYTVGGQKKAAIAAVDVETQRRVTVLSAQVQTLAAAVDALAKAKGADSDAITKAVVDKISQLKLAVSVETGA